jgi:hypothetical protein
MSCFDKVAIELQWVASYIWWITTHATCSLAFMAYKYNELQVTFATQKLSYKANCKTPFFFIESSWNVNWNLWHNSSVMCKLYVIEI